MRARFGMLRMKSLGLFCGAGMVFQVGGCDLGNITSTTTVTLDARDALRQIVTSAILGPVNNYVTGAVDTLLGVDDG